MANPQREQLLQTLAGAEYCLWSRHFSAARRRVISARALIRLDVKHAGVTEIENRLYVPAECVPLFKNNGWQRSTP